MAIANQFEGLGFSQENRLSSPAACVHQQAEEQDDSHTGPEIIFCGQNSQNVSIPNFWTAESECGNSLTIELQKRIFHVFMSKNTFFDIKTCFLRYNPYFSMGPSCVFEEKYIVFNKKIAF